MRCRLRIMMKMHGLGDGAYWMIQYLWYMCVYSMYMLLLIAFASAINLRFFRATDYSITIIFFFLWGNCLVSFAFLVRMETRSASRV